MKKESPTLENFEEIVAEHWQVVFRTIMGFLHCIEDAEDVTQEVFLKAYKHRNMFRGESAVATWLYRIAVNLSLNYISQRRHKAYFPLEERDSNRVVSGDDPHRQLERKETESAVRSAIDSLPERQRVAFVLSRYDDLSQKEIATVMKLSEGAVEQLLQRAKANLSQKLKHSVGK